MTGPGRPAQWWARIIVGLVIATMAVLPVSVSVTTWRLISPRPPAPPTYVCVYLSAKGTTTVTGSTPCAPPEDGAR